MKQLRCAIYTRKSSEEGLDQAYNSLHAQRDACEAYVLSQAGEGWSLLPTVYDDGGFSGGNMERPALKRLLAEIDAGQIDIVVVYKVDRLTRSLGDFARIVERFDKSGASFVSVTQAFNTTSSMGRLTLNVLLSFAQFEREVTGERIRDKIAASKRRGMWMGGTLPLGYNRPTDLTTRALVVNSAEAETVRKIFARYLELGSVHRLIQWLANEDIRSKRYVTLGGKACGGCSFTRGSAFHLLRSRTYVGDMVHKDQCYPGIHKAIVEKSLFDAVQAQLDLQSVKRSNGPRRTPTSPLKGLLFDAVGSPMSPAFSLGKSGRRYRYYVSTTLQQGHLGGEDDIPRRIPSPPFEALLAARLKALIPTIATLDQAVECGLLRRVEALPDSLLVVLRADAIPRWSSDPEACLAALQRRIKTDERLWRTPHEGADVKFSIGVCPRLNSGRTTLSGVANKLLDAPPRRDQGLIAALRAAHERVHQACDSKGAGAPIRTQHDRHIMQLAFLAPDIQRAILDGHQPADLTLRRLRSSELPTTWSEQRAAFGF